MSIPSAFAVLRLITSSYLVGACTGRLAAELLLAQVAGLSKQVELALFYDAKLDVAAS